MTKRTAKRGKAKKKAPARRVRKKAARKTKRTKKPPPERPGRPSKLTEDATAAICTNLATGVSLETAAAAAGIVRETLRTWLRRGARAREELERKGKLAPEEVPYAAFSERVEVVESQWKVDAMTKIASADHWTAQAWRLERRDSAQFGRGQSGDSAAEERAASQLDALMQAMHEQRQQEAAG